MTDQEITAADAPIPPPDVPEAGRRVARNTAVNTLKTALQMIITIPVTPFLIHRVGVAAYGVYVLSTSFSALGGYLSLGEFGFQSATVRYVAKWSTMGRWDEVQRVVGTTFTIFVGMGLLGGGLVALFAAFGVNAVFHIPSRLHGDARLVFYLLAVQVLFEFGLLAWTGYLEGLQRYTTTAVLAICHLLTFIIGAVVFLLLGAGVPGIAGAAALAAILHTIAAVTVSAVQEGHLRPKLGIHRDSLPELASYSSRIALIRLTSVMYDQMDKVIIGIALSPVALTIYDVANKVHLMARTALSLTSSAITPAASALDAAAGPRALHGLLVRGTRITVASAVPLATTAMILAGPLIETWIGHNFHGAAGPARLFLIYIIFTSWTTVGVTMLIGVGAVSRLVLIGVAAMLVNLVVSIALVGPVGLEGVIIGTTVGYALINIPYLKLILRQFELPLSEFARTSLARPAVVIFGHAGALLALTLLAPPEPGVEALAYAGGSLLLYAAAYLGFVADDAERDALRAIVPTRFAT